MFNDYEVRGSIYEDRLREAEQYRAQQTLIEAAKAHQRANGEAKVNLLSALAQRLHLKAQPTTTTETNDTRQNDARHAHAV